MVFVRFLAFIFILLIALVISFYVTNRFMKDNMFETKAFVVIIIFTLFFVIAMTVVQYI